MIQAKKTNAPRVICVRGLNNDISKDSWLIAVRYYVTKGQKGTDRKTCGYATESEAVADSARFRHFLESSSQKHRQQWKQSTDTTDGTQSIPVYSRIDCRNSIGVLSVTELVAFKKSARSLKLEKEFNEACSKSTAMRANFKHLFSGNYYTDREACHMKRSLAVNARKFRRTSNSQKAYVNKQKDIARRKLLLSDRIGLHLVIMKDLQVSSTCIDKENSPIGLIPSDVRLSDNSDNIQDEMSGEYVPASLLAVPNEVQQRSLKQESRFILQCFLTRELFGHLVERDASELIILNRIVTTEADLKGLLKSTFEHRTIFSMPLLAETVVIKNSHIQNITPRTLLRWFNDFEKSNYRGFKEDDRGKNKSECFITDFNLSQHFKFYMKTTNSLTIEKTRKYLEAKFLELALIKELEEYGLQFPLVRSTVYRWMRQNGANYGFLLTKDA